MDAILKYLERRTSSTFLVAYTVFWGIIHWEGIYTTFFVSQDYIMRQYGVLKNEYVERYFFRGIDDDPLGWLMGVLLPLVLACLYIWWLPKVLLIPSYKKEEEYRIEKKKIKIESESEILSAEERLTVKAADKTAAKIKLDRITAEEATINPEPIWTEEYAIFSRNEQKMEALESLRDTIYSESKGRIEDYSGDRFVDDEYIAIWDTNDLVSIGPDRDSVELTKKGKFFIKEMIEPLNGSRYGKERS